MALKSFPGKHIIISLTVVGSLALLGYLYRVPLAEIAAKSFNLFSDRERISTIIESFGASAPVVFMMVQLFQVLFAPIPGEASGFIGGYLFGTARGFLYSSIALTAGSWLNFVIGRFLGKRYIRKLIPAVHLTRFDTILKRQGIIVIFLLFIFPGFPKDYLCLFLGLSAIPAKVFILLAAIGRMPGTFMLSLQGASISEQNYPLFAFVIGISLVIVFFAYRHREFLYQWVEKFNNK